jgi:sulfopyruvate decarboxylase TPP-binding subunit
MALASAILAQLKQCGIRWLTWLPDTETGIMYRLVTTDPEMHLIGVCRENEAVGICYGLLKGGANAAVMIQNTGMLNAMDAIRGIPIRMKQPMLFMVGYRGYRGMVEKSPKVDNAAIVTEPILRALEIPYHIIHAESDAAKIGVAYADAQRTAGPAVVLLAKEYD